MRYNRFNALAISIGLAVVSTACAPSIHKVSKVLATVPLGSSRMEVSNYLAEAFPRKMRNEYDLKGSAKPMTQQMIQADLNLLAGVTERGEFSWVYPQDLFDELPAESFSDMVAMIRESTIGGGSLEILYDSNTNYLGFLAASFR